MIFVVWAAFLAGSTREIEAYFEGVARSSSESTAFSAWSIFWFGLAVVLAGLAAWLYARKSLVDPVKLHPAAAAAAQEVAERLNRLDESEVGRRTVEIEEEYRQKRIAFSSLLVSLKDMATCIDPKRIMDLALQCLRKGIDARKSVLLIKEATGDSAAPFYAAAAIGIGADELKDIAVPPDEPSLVGLAARTGSLLSERAVRESPVWDGRISMPGRLPARLACPMLAHGEVKGILTVQETVEDIDETAERFASSVAGVASLALDNARAFEMTRIELEEARVVGEEERQQKAMIKSLFQRYLAPEVVDELVARPDALSLLEGERREITVLFMDARGFTTYSETHTPEEVVSILNQYLSAMSEVIAEYGGIVDKFVGDEIMALWGAPMEQPDHAERAVRGVFRMVEVMARLQNEWVEAGIEPLDVGYGINTGPAIVGNIGSERRLDYTVIGDTVNLGARLEGLTRQHECYLIIGPRTRELLGDRIKADSLGNVAVKGKNEEIEAFKVTAMENPDVPGDWVEMRAPYAIVTGDSSRELVTQLEEGDIQQKKDALMDMGGSGLRFYMPVLEQALTMHPPALRFFARKAYHQLKQAIEEHSAGGAEWIGEREQERWSHCRELLESGSFRERIKGILDFERISKVASDEKKTRIVEQYRALLQREEHPFVIATLVRTLGMVGGRECLREISGYLSHDDPRVVANAVEGLTASPDEEFLPLVEPLMRSEDNRIRANAIRFVSYFKPAVADAARDAMYGEEELTAYRESASYLYSQTSVPAGSHSTVSD